MTYSFLFLLFKWVYVTCLYTANKRNVVLLCAIVAKTERQYGGGGSRFWLPTVLQKSPSLQNPAPTRLLPDAPFRLPVPQTKTETQSWKSLVTACYTIQMMEFALIATFDEGKSSSMVLMQYLTHGAILIFTVYVIILMIIKYLRTCAHA